MCSTVVVVTAPANAQASALSFLLMFLLGGASFPLYSLGIAYTNDWIEPEQIMGASSSLVTVNGVGAMLGPLVAASLILTLGNNFYFGSLVVTHGAVAAFIGSRIITRDGLSIEDQME